MIETIILLFVIRYHLIFIWFILIFDYACFYQLQTWLSVHSIVSILSYIIFVCFKHNIFILGSSFCGIKGEPMRLCEGIAWSRCGLWHQLLARVIWQGNFIYPVQQMFISINFHSNLLIAIINKSPLVSKLSKPN